MIRFEKVTRENFREDDYLKANPDAALCVSKGGDAYQYFLSNENETCFQYAKQGMSDQPKIDMKSSEMDLSLIEVPLESLSKHLGEKYSDIYAPIGFIDTEKIGISHQFLDDAEVYHTNYFEPKSMKSLMQVALDVSEANFINPNIFDLGSGSGNSVFACLELFPNCKILATDLSPQLLSILTKLKKHHYPNAHVECVAIDALNVKLKPSSFDIFIGAAILHHLINIDDVFKQAFSALKNHGHTYFFEPMLSGYIAMLSLLNTLIKMNKHFKIKLEPNAIEVINRMIMTLSVRANIYVKMGVVRIKDLDDKLLLTNKEIEQAARAAGFRKVKITNLNKSPRFQNEIQGKRIKRNKPLQLLN